VLATESQAQQIRQYTAAAEAAREAGRTVGLHNSSSIGHRITSIKRRP